MNKTQATLNSLAVFLVLIAGFGCSPMAELNLAGDFPNYFSDSNSEESDQDSIPEPEETLQEELAALEKIGEWQESEPSQDIDTVNSEKKITEPLYDFPITYNKQVNFYLELFQGKQRHYFERWLSRSSKYVPTIKQELKKAGLPQDLAYLAMIESGYNPSAYSRAHAAGLWQFIKSTGLHYGLRVDSWVDERREPQKATPAAIDYLSFLYKEFGDWYLAVAAYNAGEGKMARAIRKYNSRDFWKLAKHRYLKLETKRYVPKLIAAIIISREPEKYGFTNISYQDPVSHDEIAVPPLTSLFAVAMSCNSDIKTLQKLNNGLRKNMTPPRPSEYTINIPLGTHDLVATNLPLVHPVVAISYKTHVVKRGDTLTKICRTYKLNKTTLLKANNLHNAKLAAGKRLRIPYKTTKYVLLKKGESPQKHFALAGNGGQLILHSISQGETLSRIAKRYQVSPEIIMRWNGLTSIHKIRAGQQLALYIDLNDSSVAAAPGDSKLLTLVDNKKTNPAKQVAKSRKESIKYYRVRSGDSLWEIARKFKVSTLQIKKWNQLRSNTIRPGKRLIIKSG